MMLSMKGSGTPLFLLCAKHTDIVAARAHVKGGGFQLRHYPLKGRCFSFVRSDADPAAHPARESVIERGRSLIAQQPGNLRKRKAGLLDVLERKASSQAIDDLVVVCTG
jgi:hypothetical protein